MTTLGLVYRCKVSGFVGTATARAEYLEGTPQVRLTAKTEQEAEKERWIYEGLLEEHTEQKAGFA